MSHNNNIGGNVVYCGPGVTLFVGLYALFFFYDSSVNG